MDSNANIDGGKSYLPVSSFIWIANATLVVIIVFFIYGLLKKNFFPTSATSANNKTDELNLPKMKKRDFTMAELVKYDGINTETEGRILIAINGRVFDVTKGRRFYGPDGAYSVFAGRDASRAMATFSTNSAQTDYDDLSDLSPHEIESMKEWEMQFNEKYHFVGRLIKPDEEPNVYSDFESDDDNKSKFEKNDADDRSKVKDE